MSYDLLKIDHKGESLTFVGRVPVDFGNNRTVRKIAVNGTLLIDAAAL